MGRMFGRRPSRMMHIADETVAMAVDVAATFALIENDKALAEIADAKQISQTAALMTGGPPQIQWETVEEF